MNVPIRFPDPRQLAAERAREFQRLKPSERVRELVDTIATGMTLIAISPRRETIDRLFLAREQEWQRLQQDLIRKHGG